MATQSDKRGSILAMCGENCVAIAADYNLDGSNEAFVKDYKNIYQLGSRLFCGFSGSQVDMQHVIELLSKRKNTCEVLNRIELKPKDIPSLLMPILCYHERHNMQLKVETIIAGLDLNNLKPYICLMNSSGDFSPSSSYVATGCRAQQVQGMCGWLWRPNMNPEALRLCIIACLKNSTQFGVWCSVVKIIKPDGVLTELVKARKECKEYE